MKIASNKIKDIARYFREELSGLYEEGELETMLRYCFEDILNVSCFNILEHENNTVSESELLKFNFAIKDLKTEKPLQYVLGTADFYGLKLKVNEHVLIPRPETEELVHLIINDYKTQSLQAPLRFLDIGTGSGCIPISLKKHLPRVTVIAMDVSPAALEVAQQNAQLNTTEVLFVQDDILNPTVISKEEAFDVIVSNPPYIKASESELMEKNVLAYEPHLALFVNDDDSLLFYRAIADFALNKLKPGGSLYFEINAALGNETRQLIESKGFKNVTLLKDMSNKNRILRGKR